MGRSAAERQRQHRARETNGVAVFRVAVDELAVTDWLIAERLLDRAQSDSKPVIEAALAKAIQNPGASVD